LYFCNPVSTGNLYKIELLKFRSSFPDDCK